MMALNRVSLVRASILLNILLVVYLCVTWDPSSSSNLSFAQNDPLKYSYSSFEKTDDTIFAGKPSYAQSSKLKSVRSNLPLSGNVLETNARGAREDLDNPESSYIFQGGRITGPDYKEEGQAQIKDTSVMFRKIPDGQEEAVPDVDPNMQEPPREVQESVGVTETLVASVIATEAPDPPLDSLERKMYPDLRDCPTKPILPIYSQRGQYWILENYIPAAMAFRCDESVTYTTHGDFTFLDNLDTLTSRWQGPVSIGVYAPGDDFVATVDTILYLRSCWAEGIKKYVTFHLIYHTDHIPKKIPGTDELMQRKVDCSVDPPKWTNITTYRQKMNLLYPVNVARNAARRAASTYFVFPSDVELYPSTNFIPEFLKMLKKPDFSTTTKPKVFVFSIFEVRENVTAPETKTELLKMLKKGDAIPFHKKVCAKCHNVPHSKEWLEKPVEAGMSVIHVGKRLGNYKKWEPIYVGTHREPYYDERLSWEGKSDKMTQMYVLCVRDYEFLIMDNAFLVHRPGIKHYTKDITRERKVAGQNSLIKKHILPEYKILFGAKKECVV